MNVKVTDCRNAWDITKVFLENQDETILQIQMDSQFAKNGYTIVKLPYGENISLLYSVMGYDKALSPGFDLKYSGFYNRENKRAYNIREPLTHIIKFEDVVIYELQVKNMVIAAIQRAVADEISSKADEYGGIQLNGFNNEIRRDAEAAFSKKEIKLDFASKIIINDLYISESAMIDYIDNPANVNNSNSVLKRLVDDKIKDHEKELSRLWFAHCASQKLLEKLYVELESGSENK